jgi:DNA-binding PadR family transcriptional regulator
MAKGEATRLFLLAELARRGQSHGHELRREAQIGQAELWTDIGIGAIYSTLRRMADEGLIEPVRSERHGNMPERTVYAITAEGVRELTVLRDRFLREVHVPADPFDLAFSVSAGLPAGDLRAAIEDRVAALQGRITSLEHQRAAAARHLDERDQLLFEHLLARLHTEVHWHGQIISDLFAAQDTTAEGSTADGRQHAEGSGPRLIPARRDR